MIIKSLENKLPSALVMGGRFSPALLNSIIYTVINVITIKILYFIKTQNLTKYYKIALTIKRVNFTIMLYRVKICLKGGEIYYHTIGMKLSKQ